MEEKRKEEAKKAVAAVEAAETTAVLDALSQIFNGSNGGNRSDTRGVVGEVVVKTEAGPVKVAALSVKTLKAGESAKISAGEDSSAEVEIDAGEVGALGIHLALQLRHSTCRAFMLYVTKIKAINEGAKLPRCGFRIVK